MRFSPTHTTAAGVLAESTGAPVLHSLHYHGSLLRALYEAQGIDPEAILLAAVEACGWNDASPGKAPGGGGWDWLAGRFRSAGLGRLACDGLSESGLGQVGLHSSHFAAAWRARYPTARQPVCAIAGGLLARLVSEACGSDRSVEETACEAQGAEACAFEVVAAERPGPGTLHRDSASSSRPSRVRAVRSWESAIAPGQSLVASAEGLIAGAGGPFAALPTEFYAALSHLFELEVPRARGAKFASLPGILLMEAAHWNGFRLYGELLAAEEGRDAAGTDGDFVQRLLALPERLGWGSWEIRSFVPGERLIVRILDSYEAIGHERLFGRSAEPRCLVARGAAAAVMNLLYRSDGKGAADGGSSAYNALFRSPHTFRAVETRCRAQGDDCCELVTNPLTV